MNINFHLRTLVRRREEQNRRETAGQLSEGLTLAFQVALLQDTPCLQAWGPSLPQSVKALVNLVLAV